MSKSNSNPQETYDKVLVIGNGFDINMGFETSYTAFLKSAEFQEITKNHTDGQVRLTHYLDYINSHSASIGKNWVDLEHELKNYTTLISQRRKVNLTNITKRYQDEVFQIITGNKPPNLLATIGNQILQSPEDLKRDFYTARQNFEKQFVQLKHALVGYLKRITSEHDSIPVCAAKNLVKNGSLIKSDHSYGLPFSQCFSLNYTDLLAKSLPKLTQTHIHYLHGTLNNNDIVFGVEDGSIHDDFWFLTKGAHAAMGYAPELSFSIKDADEVHFFGCSFGDTDNAHFVEAFRVMSENRSSNHKSKRKLVFYAHNREAYKQTFKRLMTLTNNTMSQFKNKNQLIFVEIPYNSEARVIDQAWINELSVA